FAGDGRKEVNVLLSPDGRTLATTGRVKPSPPGGGAGLQITPDSEVELWDLTAGQHLRTINPGTRSTFALAFTPDGRALVTRTWDAATGKPLGVEQQHAEGANLVLYSPDRRRFVVWATTGENKRSLRLHDAATKRVIAEWPHSGDAFSPDGRWLALLTDADDV